MKQLTPNERAAIKTAMLCLPGYCTHIYHTLQKLLDRTAPIERFRYVVHCSTERTAWTKGFSDREEARKYARYACYKWCAMRNVKIVRQRWITT